MAEQPADADVAQLVERNLAKVEVAGSNLVIRSNVTKPLLFGGAAFVIYHPMRAVITRRSSPLHLPKVPDTRIHLRGDGAQVRERFRK